MPAIKLHKRLPNLSPKEEQIVTEMLCEMYASGFENGKPKWIPVRERLPEEKQLVLAVCKSRKIFVGDCWDCHGTIIWRIKTARDSTKNITQIVTHWMPLPSAEGLE